MSFGALSDKAKVTLALASAAAGTATNTGEGGMLPEERKNAKILIGQYSTARFGISDQFFKDSDAVEIKIGQGAKPGQGGLLLMTRRRRPLVATSWCRLTPKRVGFMRRRTPALSHKSMPASA